MPPLASPRAASAGSLLDSPLTSLLLGVAGGALLGSGRSLSGRERRLATLAGVAFIGVASLRPLSGLLVAAGTRRRATDLRLSYVVALPVERVFAFCRDFENFPRFIGALRSVRDFGDGRSRWCASTPAGDDIAWDAVTTKYVPNRVIAWETTAGSPVRATALLRFRPEGGRTCLELSLDYELAERSPLRDAMAALLTPQRDGQLRADIARMVHYLETAPEAELEAYGL